MEDATARLIPAHAGKTSSSWKWPKSWTAHPRSRGENSESDRNSSGLSGSSPLTRGKRYSAPPVGDRRRLIPAHAGKTRRSSRSWWALTAHPRSRGENDPGSTQPERLMGSSPLTRGKRHVDRRRPELRRLIPAHAGKTRRGMKYRGAFTAHPRSRGENRARRDFLVARDGSSPLTRGKHLDGDGRHPVGRLIPAHAGKTHPPPGRACPPSAHPRSRGENLSSSLAIVSLDGSSPLTRGKLRHRADGVGNDRLIPAHAGKTGRALHVESDVEAHPRSRGENRRG